MAARIHLNDQFSLCPPITHPIRERFSSSKGRVSSSSAAHRSKPQKPPLNKPAFLDRIANFEIRSSSLSRRPLATTPRGVKTQQSERIPANSETVSPRKHKFLEANSVIAKNVEIARGVGRKISPLEATPKQDFTLVKVRVRRKPQEDLEAKVDRESDSVFPNDTKKWKETTRILWARRVDCREKPIVVVNWEGVIGAWHRAGYCEPCELYVRQGWEQGIKGLMHMFAVALVLEMSMARRNKILAMCAAKGIVFDAVYKKRKADGTSFLLDYSQILSDFGLLLNPKPVLILSSVGIDIEDLQVREGMALIREESLSRPRKYLWYVPISHNSPAGSIPPLCLLVPNLLLSGVCARMEFIVKAIGEWVRFEGHLNRSMIDFREFVSRPPKHGLKKLSIPSDILSTYREELKGLDQSYSRPSDSLPSPALFLVLTSLGHPSGQPLINTDHMRPPKNSERRFERKLSTKSLI